MRKGMGISIIVLGAIMTLFCGYGLLAYSMQSKEDIAKKYAPQGIDAGHYYREGLETHRKNGIIVMGIMTLVSAGIAFGGYKLHKKR